MPERSAYRAEDFLADESFVKYLLQQNEEDIALWKNLLASGSLNQNEFILARKMFFAVKQDFKAIDKKEELQQLQSMINQGGENEVVLPILPKVVSIKNKRKIIPGILKYAAAIAVIFLLTDVLYFTNTGAHIVAVGKKAVAVYATSTNNNYTAILPDGSHVILNKNSSISIDKNFNKSKREVTLKGTAFFEVTKNPDKPFTVISGDVSTTALGTSFYIHQSSNTMSTSVSLLTGKVKVNAEGSNFVHLIPYEKAIYAQDKQLTKQSFDQQKLVDWTNGIIRFNKADMKQISTVMEEFFDKKIIISGTPKDISFTGEFKADQLEPILGSLQFTYDLKYTIQDNTVNIFF